VTYLSAVLKRFAAKPVSYGTCSVD